MRRWDDQGLQDEKGWCEEDEQLCSISSNDTSEGRTELQQEHLGEYPSAPASLQPHCPAALLYSPPSLQPGWFLFRGAQYLVGTFHLAGGPAQSIWMLSFHAASTTYQFCST